MTIQQQMFLRIAGYTIELDARDSNCQLTVPLFYKDFITETLGAGENQQGHHLRLQVQDQMEFLPTENDLPVCRTDIWELWVRNDSQYIFYSPRQVPPRCVMVDKSFTHGIVGGGSPDFWAEPFYPLLSIDIRLMVNWLAQTGDLILHAAGFRYGGDGYCFIGHSGVGKSTLISALPKGESLTILGEDQVILRKVEDKYWIFGTPWHESADRCSPLGAPLRKIFFLDRSAEVTPETVGQPETVARILNTAFVPYYLSDKLPLILDKLANLSDMIPVYLLKHVLGEDILSIILGKPAD